MLRNKAVGATQVELHIDASPAVGGKAEARLRGSWVPVWALIGHIPLVGADAEVLATAYDVSVDEAKAALAFYEQHRDVIDARIEANQLD